MKTYSIIKKTKGVVVPAILWLIGIPIPIILVVLLIRGC